MACRTDPADPGRFPGTRSGAVRGPDSPSHVTVPRCHGWQWRMRRSTSVDQFPRRRPRGLPRARSAGRCERESWSRRATMVAWPGLVRPGDPHGQQWHLGRFANAEKPGFRGWTSPSGERVPSGNISTISPLQPPQRFFQPREREPSRSIGMASSDWISSRNGANANSVCALAVSSAGSTPAHEHWIEQALMIRQHQGARLDWVRALGRCNAPAKRRRPRHAESCKCRQHDTIMFV